MFNISSVPSCWSGRSAGAASDVLRIEESTAMSGKPAPFLIALFVLAAANSAALARERGSAAPRLDARIARVDRAQVLAELRKSRLDRLRRHTCPQRRSGTNRDKGESNANDHKNC